MGRATEEKKRKERVRVQTGGTYRNLKRGG